MSLMVWLPLNGDLTNQGLSGEITQITAPVFVNNGKIGKAMSTGSAKLTAAQASNILNNNQMSFCFWIYVNAATGDTTNRAMIFGNGGMGANNNRKFSIFQYPSCNDLHLSWMNDAASTTFIASVDSGVLPSYQWTHVAITYNNPVCTVYINGNKLVSRNGVSNSSSFAYDTILFSNIPNQARYLNDFRIYDHALSPKEVKELAKGLVLHYRLAGPGQANLTKGNNTYERNSASTDGWFWFSGSNFNCKPSTTYTLSIDIDGTISNFHGGSASTDPAKRWASMWFYLCKTGTSTNAAGGGYDSPINLNSTNYNFRKIGPTRYAWTYTTPADARSLSIRGNTYSNGTNAIKVKFWNPKIEEGTIATPWCPRSDESIYTSLGYNNNIEYDCSGFKNNGTKSGNITWDIDSPRYTTSYKFNTGSDYIKTNFSAIMNELSISFWVKPSPSNGGYSIICSNYNNPTGGLWISTNCEGGSVWAYRGAYMTVSGSLANDTWHHCVYTFKDGVSKWYINGEEKTLSRNTYTGTTLPITDLTIGNSYTGTSWNTKRYGNLSDFRIYATALSAEDIAELYHSAVIVDNTGKSYAYEYFEAN